MLHCGTEFKDPHTFCKHISYTQATMKWLGCTSTLSIMTVLAYGREVLAYDRQVFCRKKMLCIKFDMHAYNFITMIFHKK